MLNISSTVVKSIGTKQRIKNTYYIEPQKHIVLVK